MEQIVAIEINYFRSIYTLTLKDVRRLNMYSGQNDVGKSNILKALNLFFNNQTDFETTIDFYRDYSVKRLEEVRQTIKSKQFIQVKITFDRGNRCTNTLPQKFTVNRRWYRDSKYHDQTTNLKQALKKERSYTGDNSEKELEKDLVAANTSLTRFLNTIKYIYVPAIKDNQVFSSIIGNLQEFIFTDSTNEQGQLTDQLTQLNKSIISTVDELSRDFKKATGIPSTISLPTSLRELYKAFFIHTGFGEKGEFLIPLEQRGDGIRIRYLPSILHYIARLSSDTFIWGFEEPENSLEYKLCTRMAHDFLHSYCNSAQIFLTTHSPAFFLLKNERLTLERIVQREFNTCKLPYEDCLVFIDDLGITELQHKLVERLGVIEKAEQRVRKLEDRIRDTEKPLILTEGKTDKYILSTAWEKLHPGVKRPFNIESCDVLPEDHASGGSGGWETLHRSLETVQPFRTHIVIGIFDNDEDAVKYGFNKLSKNFYPDPSRPHVKLHSNGKAIALLLPVPDGKEKFAKFGNLPIEFYFDDEALNTIVEGRKLNLVPQKAVTKLQSGVTIDVRDTIDPYFLKIDRSTKMHFAKKVVPTLNIDKFRNFQVLFDLLSEFSEEKKAKKHVEVLFSTV